MQVLGDLIKETRKKKKLSQAELAQGICTQATVSNVESKNKCDSLIIFSSICSRLNLQVEDCVELSEDQKLLHFLDKIEGYCSRLHYKEAHELLVAYDVSKVQGGNDLTAKYNYYRGITALLGEKNMSDALFYLHRVGDFDKKTGLYHILSLNGFGIYYVFSNELERAKLYYDKSLDLLTRYEGEWFPSAYRLFFNSAKFYSLIGNYQRAIVLCVQGIGLTKEKGGIYYLDSLYYELGFNKLMVEEDPTEEYQTAYYFAKHLGSTDLLETIFSDAEKYDLSLGFTKGKK